MQDLVLHESIVIIQRERSPRSFLLGAGRDSDTKQLLLSVVGAH
jgi:hypothetical protein